MKVLLHTCCGPCLLYPYALLKERGHEVVSFYYNPNIHPSREYRKRLEVVRAHCEGNSIELREGPYDMEAFLAAASTDPAARCDTCFKMRLSRAAAEARLVGASAFTTTLLVSPYQDQEKIRRAGESAAIEQGVLFIFEDMSGGYHDAVSESRELGMYRQGYCGCVYSEKERYEGEVTSPR